jgi:hypothetical protein
MTVIRYDYDRFNRERTFFAGGTKCCAEGGDIFDKSR